MKYEVQLDMGVWVVMRGDEIVGQFLSKNEAHKSAAVFNAWVEAARALNKAPGGQPVEPLFS